MMKPFVLKPRTSYRDQFLSRHDMENQQLSPSSKKQTRIPIPSILKVRSNKITADNQSSKSVAPSAMHCVIDQESMPDRRRRVYQDARVQENEGRNYNVEARRRMVEEDRENENDQDQLATMSNAIVVDNNGESTNKYDIQPSSGRSSYRHMISDYAKALDLNDMERQCLGFHEIDQEDDIDSSSIGNKDCEKAVSLKQMNEYEESISQRKCMPKSAKGDDDKGSPWSSLVDQLSLRNWFAPPTDNDNAANTTDEDRDDHNDDGEPMVEMEYSYDEPGDPYDLMTSGVLTMIDNICDGDHVDGMRNCYKCQYKESFKSYIMNNLKELDDILMNQQLSPSEQSMVFNEALYLWIFQLSEQNLSLADAYNESVQSSEKLKSILLQSRNSMRPIQKELDKAQAYIDALKYEVLVKDKTITTLRYEREREVEQKKVMEDTLQETQADVDSLTELVRRLRDKGVWDIHGLPLGAKTSKKIFNEDYYLHGSKVISHKEFSAKKREWKNEIEQLKSEKATLRAVIAAKDKEIHRLKSP